MKSVLKLTTVAVFMLIAISGNAKDLKPHLTATKNEKSLVLHLDAQPEKANVKIIDGENEIIYSENVRIKNVFNKKFDLNTLVDGNYFMAIENSLKKITYTITIKNNILSVGERKEITKPFFRSKGNTLLINHLNRSMQKVTIRVEDLNSNVLFKEAYDNLLTVGKSLNFKNVAQGTYRVIVSDSNNAYSKNIDIK